MASSQCCANPPTLSPACGDGIVVDDLGGVRAYTAGSHNSKLAVLLISDIYGDVLCSSLKLPSVSCPFPLLLPSLCMLRVSRVFVLSFFLTVVSLTCFVRWNVCRIRSAEFEVPISFIGVCVYAVTCVTSDLVVFHVFCWLAHVDIRRKHLKASSR